VEAGACQDLQWFVALGAFFTEISGFGLSLKRDVRDAKDTAHSAKIAADEASVTSRSADTTAQVAQNVSLETLPRRGVRATGAKQTLETEIASLAQEYDTVRHTQDSGSARTSTMTSIITKMIALLNNVEADSFDVSSYLRSPDEGMRLAGYAYLYANPDPRRAQEVSATLMQEKPFGQYWALRTLRRLVVADPSSLDLNTRRSLEGLLGSLAPNTDRAYEIRQVLDAAESKARC
jgi:hypothetical protein